MNHHDLVSHQSAAAGEETSLQSGGSRHASGTNATTFPQRTTSPSNIPSQTHASIEMRNNPGTLLMAASRAVSPAFMLSPQQGFHHPMLPPREDETNNNVDSLCIRPFNPDKDVLIGNGNHKNPANISFLNLVREKFVDKGAEARILQQVQEHWENNNGRFVK
jgi:hypothetical protein